MALQRKTYDGDFWRGIADFCSNQVCGDVTLVCSGGKVLSTHRLLLAALSDNMIRILRGHAKSEGDEGVTVYLPETDVAEVSVFLNVIVQKMAGGEEVDDVWVPGALADHLGVKPELLIGKEVPPQVKEEESIWSTEREHEEVQADVDVYRGYHVEEQGGLEEEEDVVEEEEEGESGEEDADFDYEEEVIRHRAVRAIAHKRGQRPERENGGVKRRRRVGGPQPNPFKNELEAEDDLTECLKFDSDLSQVEQRLKGLLGDVDVDIQPRLFHLRRPPGDKSSSIGAFFGVRLLGAGNELEAFPIVWSKLCAPNEDEMASQFALFRESLQRCVGLSFVEASYFPNLLTRMEISRSIGYCTYQRSKWKSKLQSLSASQLRAALNNGELGEAVKGGEPLQSPDKLALELKGPCKLNLSPNMLPESYDAMLFVTFGADGSAPAYFLGMDEPRQTVATEIFKGLADVWLWRTGQARLKNCDAVMYAQVDAGEIVGQWLAINDLLKKVEEGEDLGEVELSKICDVCGKQMTANSATKLDNVFRSHMLSHDLSSFNCKCDVDLPTEAARKNHIKLCHMSGYVECRLCGLAIKESVLAAHKHREHEEMVCDICGTSVQGKRMMDMHLADNHKELLSMKTSRKKILGGTCDICGKSFPTPLRMYTHKMTTHRPVKCRFCGKQCQSKNAERSHIRSQHTEEKEVACPECGKVFRRMRNLQTHKRLVHTPEEEYRFPCPQCERR